MNEAKRMKLENKELPDGSIVVPGLPSEPRKIKKYPVGANQNCRLAAADVQFLYPRGSEMTLVKEQERNLFNLPKLSDRVPLVEAEGNEFKASMDNFEISIKKDASTKQLEDRMARRRAGRAKLLQAIQKKDENQGKEAMMNDIEYIVPKIGQYIRETSFSFFLLNRTDDPSNSIQTNGQSFEKACGTVADKLQYAQRTCSLFRDNQLAEHYVLTKDQKLLRVQYLEGKIKDIQIC